MIEVNGIMHMQNSQGHLVPVDRVDQIDKLRDETVRELIGMAEGISGGLREGRTKMLDAVAAFVSISGEQYGSKVGGEKGNVTLHSYDGTMKVYSGPCRIASPLMNAFRPRGRLSMNACGIGPWGPMPTCAPLLMQRGKLTGTAMCPPRAFSVCEPSRCRMMNDGTKP